MNDIDNFEKVIDSIYGVYLDSTLGFRRVIEWVEKNQLKHIEILKVTNPNKANINYLDGKAFIFGKGNPNIPSSVVLHKTTQKELKYRNKKDGINFKFIGNLATVSLYQYWEDCYRNKIAQLFHKNKNEITAPIMGDIRLLRRSIIHHQGIALKEIESCKVLKWFFEGDEIFIDKEKFYEIIYHIKIFITLLKSDIVKI